MMLGFAMTLGSALVVDGSVGGNNKGSGGTAGAANGGRCDGIWDKGGESNTIECRDGKASEVGMEGVVGRLMLGTTLGELI
jgi:hypothetical protein